MFCDNFGLPFINPHISTVSYFITHLTQRFSSAASVRNYVSGIRTMHKQLGLTAHSLDSYPIACLLRAADLTMRRPPLRRLPITPHLLTQLCVMCDSAGPLGPSLKVALTFGFFGMLRQSNLAPASQNSFDPSRHTCRGDIRLANPGVVVRMRWSKTLQTMDRSPLLPLPQVSGHPADPVAAYRQLIQSNPTTHPRQPLLSFGAPQGLTIVTVPMLARSLRDLLDILGHDPGLYSLHSLRRGGATTAYTAGVDSLDVKRHGNWASDTFWIYVTSPFVANSPVATALGAAVKALN